MIRSSMNIIRGWKELAEADKGASVALGNFDGVHLGHQRVIAGAANAAAQMGIPLGVISFEPHARTYFQPDAPPFRLMAPSQLERTVAALGTKKLYMLPFGPEMASLTDHDFVRDVLVAGLGVRHVAVGFDVTFGKGRTGDPQSMLRYGDAYGFSVSVASALVVDEAKISSSSIREFLHLGKPDKAAVLLGRPFAIEGVVEKGRQLGRTLGFPTANVPLGDYVVPRFGVYVTRTRLRDGRQIGGVANIGVNPTTGAVAPRLEVWLFDFSENIYGETIETELLEFIRPEEHFPTTDAMVLQIHQDSLDARRILGP